MQKLLNDWDPGRSNAYNKYGNTFFIQNCFSVLGRVKAQAVIAICLPRGVIVVTAVPSVPFAAGHIVFIITVSVTLPLRCWTSLGGCHWSRGCWMVGIQAEAIVAVSVPVGSFAATAVSSIPSTQLIVVCIITITCRKTAFLSHFQSFLVTF